jgi:localization factor PodJL
MRFGFPWSAKEIPPQARVTAEEAARRAGMSLSDWLNSVITQQAEQAGVQPPAVTDDDFHSGDLAAVNHRLDDLARRIEQLARTGPAAYAPKRIREAADRPADEVPPPDMSSARVPPSVERFVAEIAARQRMLNDAPPPQPRQEVLPVAAPAPPLQPAQDLSGLENQLRNITDQIETLRKPDVENAINALREELGEIGHTLSEAMPRRALEAIESQIRGLDQRIAEGRQAGIDAGALGGIEHGLAEVRDALHGLMPAENLVGFNDAITGVAHKIDLIVAQNDPATLAQLESSIITLREMTNHIASNETVQGLAAEVQALGEKIEAMASAGTGGEAFNHLEHRIVALSDSLAERAHDGGAAPPRLEALVESLQDKIEQIQIASGTGEAFNNLEHRIAALTDTLAERTPSGDAFNQLEHRIAALADMMAERAQSGDAVAPRLEALMESMHDKIEQIQNARGSGDAFGHLEDRIVGLVEKLDASDSRLSHLEGIERGLTDLLVHIEDLRTNRDAGGLRAEGAPQVDDLKHDIARTQDALEAVHGTLGHVVDRLAMIEKDIRGETRAAPDGVRVVDDAPALAAQMPASPAAADEPLAPPARRRAPAASQTPAGSDGPVDQPLEPGSGRPLSPTNPAARIAASEAALAGTSPAAAPSGKSSFIAAARRAAQAAGKQPNTRVPRNEAGEAQASENASLTAKVIKRVKSLFIAASIIAIVVGSVQIAGNIFNLHISPTKMAQAPTSDTPNAEAAAPRAEPDPTPGPAAAPLALPKLPALGSSALPSSGTIIATVPAHDGNPATNAMSSFFAPPMLGSTNDVTGSIPRPASKNQTAAPIAQPSQPAAEQLPAAIGSAKLRNAAMAGDAAAAYAVAVRFAEGRGVPASAEEAARWFERAASKGLAPAQFRYASLLEKGLGVKKDIAQARRLYLAAAGKGNSKAMHNLAVLYAEGIDGKPDYTTAVQWFRRAAQRGIADSQYNLGVLCARGLGTEKSFEEAYKWFALAAAQGDREAAKKRDEIASGMDDSKLTAAQQAVKNFVVEPQPQDAVTVREPAGGWDHAAGAPSHAKTRPPGPLVLGAFEAGNR